MNNPNDLPKVRLVQVVDHADFGNILKMSVVKSEPEAQRLGALWRDDARRRQTEKLKADGETEHWIQTCSDAIVYETRELDYYDR